MRIRLFFVIAFLLRVFTAHSQIHAYSIEYLTIDQGLPHNGVTSIIQDKKGFIWFGTYGGLTRYDGQNMRVFQFEPGNPNSLTNNSIIALFESSDRKIWIGTKSGGLNCFDPLYETFSHYMFDAANPKSISGDDVLSVAETTDGIIWVGTNGNGLNWLDERTKEFHRLLKGHIIIDLLCAPNGTLWIVSTGGLFKIEKGSKTPTMVPLVLPKEATPASIAMDKENGLLFMAGWEMGLVIYDVRKQKVVKHIIAPRDLASGYSNDLYSLHWDQYSKKLWIGSWGEGLKCMTDDFTLERILIAPEPRTRHNTNYDVVLDIFGDQSGNIWVGTDDGGVCKLSAQNSFFKSYTFNNSELSAGHVLCMVEGEKGSLWIGTKGGGLDELRGEKIIHRKIVDNELRNVKVNNITTLYKDVDDVIWFGSDFGLHKIKTITNDKIHVESFSPDRLRNNSLSDRMITAIHRDRQGTFWVGTHREGINRLIRYDEDGLPVFKGYRSNQRNIHSLATNRISCFFEDRKGRFWVGTFKGLHLYKPDIDGFLKIFHEPEKAAGLSNDIVTCITEDHDGNIWVGTPSGLNKIIVDKGVLQASYLTRKDGLPNDYINSIQVDDAGMLWIGSNGGLFRFNVKDHEVHLFNVKDGLQSNAFSENAAFKGTNGIMYFGGVNGFSAFNPMEEFTVDVLPLAFTSLKIMNREVQPGIEINGRKPVEKSISYTDNITLTHRDKVISVGVASLDFAIPEKKQYAFKLEGFDTEWADFQSSSTVTYTNLKAGTYTLLAKVGDSGNVWVGEPIALRITVLPAPWETWWAYTLYAGAIVAIVLLFRRIEKKHIGLKDAVQAARLEKLKEKEISEMKIRFFTNVSHELKTPLTLITSPLEELLVSEGVPKKVREKLLLMHRHSDRLLTLIHQLLDLRKAESGNMKLLVEQLDIVKFAFDVFNSFIDLAESRNIAYHFQSEIENLLIAFDKNKIEMALTNILSNAFKHTPESGAIYCRIEVEKEITSNKAFCNISVKDSGRGIPQEVKDKIFDLYYQVTMVDSVKISGTGIGLSLVKEIMQMHEGCVTVESIEGKGSQFTLKLPLKPISEDAKFFRSPNAQPETKVEIANEKDTETSAESAPQKEIDDSEKDLILVIEDTNELRNYLVGLLTDEFSVIQASSGEDGLKLAMAKIPDIIISDVMMEKIDGFEVCHNVKNNVNTSHIPVLLLTAKNMPENELSGFNVGADDYVKKPFNPAILIARVKRLLESRKQLKEYYGRKITLQPTNIEITSYDEIFLQKAMTYVEANLQNQDLTTESLGLELAMSHSTLYRKLKALTGLTINEFIRSIRIKRAAQLLETGEYSVSEAAFETGFSEVKYFRNYFKEQFGCPPSEYMTHKKT